MEYFTNINDKSNETTSKLVLQCGQEHGVSVLVTGGIHTHQSHNWCQIFLQLLKFEQVLVKGGIGRPALSAQTSVENIVSSLPPAGYIEEEDIGVECFNMTKW